MEVRRRKYSSSVGARRGQESRAICRYEAWSAFWLKGDLGSGASGRNQGLLHSGGRYAVSDPHTARECIGETGS